MSSNDQNEDPKKNDVPENEQADGLSAEQAAEARPYDEVEAWKKSKNALFSVLGIIALGVAISSFYHNSQKEEAAERSLRFLNASLGDVGSEEKFLSFAEDYDDTLGGVAQYRAASIQYGEGRYAGISRKLPYSGKAFIRRSVTRACQNWTCRIPDEGWKKRGGKSALLVIANDDTLLNVDRFEARYLLGVEALGADNREGYEAQRTALGEDEKAADYLSRLVEFEKLNRLYNQAESLPDINLAKGAEYLSEQRKRKGVKETESGILYEVLKDGNGSLPVLTDEVEVHYHGTLVNGEVFDSSRDRGEPAKFRLNQVIAGWTEALQLMKVGAKWKIFIPADLAYGKNGSNSIGPNETLTFEVELLSITPPIVEPELPDLNDSEPLPAVFPEDSNESAKAVAKEKSEQKKKDATKPAKGQESNASK